MSDRTGQLESPDARLGELYRRHAAWLARRLRSRFGEEADDIAHEAWRRLMTGYGDASAVRHPRSLLMRIAVNFGIDLAQKARRDRTTISAATETEAGAQEASVLLEQIILGLPEPLRDVFVMSRFGGLSQAQIAERLGISPKTVEWRMTKALAHCAAQLRR